MLVLSRKKSEKIIVGNEIELTILDVRGDKVRIGIDAPEDVLILRQEVKDARDRDESQGIKCFMGDSKGTNCHGYVYLYEYGPNKIRNFCCNKCLDLLETHYPGDIRKVDAVRKPKGGAA